jgi:hypothetical protein
LNIDILGVTEHSLHIHHRNTAKNLQLALRSTITEKTIVQMDASNSATTQQYLPGGTGLIMIGTTIGRIEPKGQGGDKMGRWSYVHLRRKNTAPITIISAYQVNKNPTNTIGNTAWHQQRLHLDAIGKHDLHPRAAFIDDIILFIQELQRQQHDVIIGGDFNDTIYRHNSGLLNLITKTDLVDVWHHRNPNHESFNTYSRGTERIDTVLCTNPILPYIQKRDMLRFNG